MMGRVGALFAGILLALAGFALLGGRSDSAGAAAVCPPRTFDDLTTTTTTEPEPTSSTTLTDAASTTLVEQSTTTTPAPPAAKPPRHCAPYVYEMGFPLAVRGSFISGFGDERDGGDRLHKGVDVESPKLTAVLAVKSGEVAQIHNQAGSEDCCWLAVEHDDGWESWYIHLNNDSYGTDDGQSVGVRVDLEVGDTVEEGEVIGWLGDSGNAEDTNTPHVHFELHRPDGMAIDPYASLVAAASSAEPPQTGVESGAYVDDDGRLYEWVFEALAANGLYWPCSSGTATSCADDTATPRDLAALASLLSGADDPPMLRGSYGEFSISGAPDPHPYLVEKVLGCEEEDLSLCPIKGVTERELTRLAAGIITYRKGPPDRFRLPLPDEVWALVLPSARSSVEILDDLDHFGECQLPLDEDRLLSRGQGALLLLSWIGDWDPIPCPQPVESLELD
jgi:murein DD-endopeptidase MepM/ murein hydrolase activator NlpD